MSCDKLVNDQVVYSLIDGRTIMKRYLNRRTATNPYVVIPMVLAVLIFAMIWSEIIISLID